MNRRCLTTLLKGAESFSVKFNYAFEHQLPVLIKWPTTRFVAHMVDLLWVVYFSTELQTSIMVGLVYFVTLHAGFVLIGMFNLARAMAKKLPMF